MDIKYEENSPYYDMILKYYYMEYNAFCVGEDYRKEMFIL